ncbi:MAG: sugar ABC transporter permease [Clostridiales bacterium]|nr:sugar ABC transporter permease [Clostridiales bacterium]
MKYRSGNWRGRIRRDAGLYLLLLPAVIYVLVFLYAPMGGVLIAFKDYTPTKGIWGSPWAGFKYFEKFLNAYNFKQIFFNTVSLSVYNLAAQFPIPILFALLLNQMRHKKFKQVVQTVSYAPHFISTVVLVGMLNVFLSPSTGVVNALIKVMGGEAVYFLGKAELFRPVYVWSSVWQDMGRSAIIYIAALTSIEQELHEAAMVDGASKFQRTLHIDIPGIMPTVVIMLILNLGRIMTVGFEKAYLMQNTLNITASEIISTYVYKVGLLNAQFSLSTAIGLFNSVISCVLVIAVNTIARRLGDTSLW